jgi:hypothetical protein
VLHAVTLEQTMMPIVHQHRKVHHDLVLGLGENDLLMVLESDDLGGDQHLLDRLMEEIGRIPDDLEFFEDTLGEVRRLGRADRRFQDRRGGDRAGLAGLHGGLDLRHR